MDQLKRNHFIWNCVLGFGIVLFYFKGGTQSAIMGALMFIFFTLRDILLVLNTYNEKLKKG